MKYIVELSVRGYVEVEAETKEEARRKVEDGWSLNDFVMQDDDIEEVYPTEIYSH